MSDVPSMAIEKYHMWQNPSIMQDEVLAHRLGPDPLRTQFPPTPARVEPGDGDGARHAGSSSLEVKCTKDPSPRPVRGQPRVDRQTDLRCLAATRTLGSPRTPGPQQKDILINKLRPGHEMEISYTH